MLTTSPTPHWFNKCDYPDISDEVAKKAWRIYESVINNHDLGYQKESAKKLSQAFSDWAEERWSVETELLLRGGHDNTFPNCKWYNITGKFFRKSPYHKALMISLLPLLKRLP